MQDLTDDERKGILGEVLMDEFKVIREYLQDIPDMKQQLNNVHALSQDTNDRLKVVESVVREHETEIKSLKHKIA